MEWKKKIQYGLSDQPLIIPNDTKMKIKMKELLSLADNAINGLRYIIDVMCVEACHGYTSILCLFIISISIFSG